VATNTHSLSDALLAGMVSISADAIVAVDDSLRITFFNAGAEHIFGYAADEVLGQPLAILLPERFRAAHHGHVTLFGTSHDRARRMGERQEISGLRRNGEEFAAEASIARLELEGRIVYTTVLRDISDRKKIERELRAAVRARDDMAGIVSHDLRNPVQAIKMLAGAILASAERPPEPGFVPPDPSTLEQVAVIRHAALQMDALIQDLLDVTRIDAHQLHVSPQPTDPAQLVGAALDTLAPLAEDKGQTLDLETAPVLPRVMADAGRIEQILSNLVGNAIKFTPSGGRLGIALRPSEDGRFVVVTVRDDGPGIDAEQLPHVFDRYWQSKRSGRRGGGAGLGLPIAKGIVEAHGGRIWVEAAAGRGTVVSFTLPVAPG